MFKILKIGTAFVTGMTLVLGTAGVASATPAEEFEARPVTTIVSQVDTLTTDELEQPITPMAAPAIIPALALIVASGVAIYNTAYNDGKMRAATGQFTRSQWDGAPGWAIFAWGLGGPLQQTAYQGWKAGFLTECANHSYCWNQ